MNANLKANNPRWVSHYYYLLRNARSDIYLTVGCRVCLCILSISYGFRRAEKFIVLTTIGLCTSHIVRRQIEDNNVYELHSAGAPNWYTHVPDEIYFGKNLPRNDKMNIWIIRLVMSDIIKFTNYILDALELSCI